MKGQDERGFVDVMDWFCKICDERMEEHTDGLFYCWDCDPQEAQALKMYERDPWYIRLGEWLWKWLKWVQQ